MDTQSLLNLLFSSAGLAGPITINSGITVTIPSGGRWVVL